jgi:protein SCO1/2
MPGRFHVAAGALAAAAGVAAVVFLWPRKPPPEPPAVISSVPDFRLTDQEGKGFDSATALRGKPWIANFIFTRCTTVCPVFTARMAQVDKLARERKLATWLVSFSVDPDHDTPEVLKAYAAERGVSTERWSFLTGKTDEITRTVTGALKMHVEKVGGKPVGESIMHGTHFVLVDGAMKVRGYYNLSDADALDRLLSDLSRVQ